MIPLINYQGLGWSLSLCFCLNKWNEYQIGIRGRFYFTLYQVETKEVVPEDAILYRALIRSLEIIGLANKKLDEELKSSHPQMEWKKNGWYPRQGNSPLFWCWNKMVFYFCYSVQLRGLSINVCILPTTTPSQLKLNSEA